MKVHCVFYVDVIDHWDKVNVLFAIWGTLEVAERELKRLKEQYPACHCFIQDWTVQ